MYKIIRLVADFEAGGLTYPAGTYGHVHAERGDTLDIALPDRLDDDASYSERFTIDRAQTVDMGFTPTFEGG